MPQTELLQDLAQFRIIPHKDPRYFRDYSLNNNLQPEQANNNNKTQKQQSSQQHLLRLPKNNICKTSFIIHEKEKRQANQKVQQTNTTSATTPIVQEKPMKQALQKKIAKKQENKNLSRILGLLNIQKGAVAIQSEKVRILDDEDDDIEVQQDGSFFLTEQTNNNNQCNTTVNNQKSDQNKTSNSLLMEPFTHRSNTTLLMTSKRPRRVDKLGLTVKKRVDQKVIQWSKDKTPNKSFLDEFVQQKMFMQAVGPGTYNLNYKTQILPKSQKQSTNSFHHNHTKLQELLTLKKESLKLKDSLLHDHMLSSRSKSVLNNYQSTFSIQGIRQPFLSSTFNDNHSPVHTTVTSLLKNTKPLHLSLSSHYKPYGMMENTAYQSCSMDERCPLVERSQMEMTHVGPGSYHLPNSFGTNNASQKLNDKVQRQKMIMHKTQNARRISLPNNQNDRFNYFHKQLEVSRNQPGPGQYTITQHQITKDVQQDNDPTLSISERVRLMQKQNYPSFGTKQIRELKLTKDEALPGPGQYQLNFNLENLLSKCEDKELVKAIQANLHNHKPNKVFVTKEPRIAVFQEDKLKKEDGLEKFYDQHSNTIMDQQLRLKQKKLEKLIQSLTKDYPNQKLNINTAVNTLQFERFKDDKKILESQMLGPGSYNTTTQFEIKQSNARQQQLRPSAVFKSKVQRNGNYSGTFTKHQINNTQSSLNDSQQQLTMDQSYLSDYKSQWEKKSFNMKYNKQGVALRNNFNKSVSQEVKHKHL